MKTPAIAVPARAAQYMVDCFAAAERAAAVRDTAMKVLAAALGAPTNWVLVSDEEGRMWFTPVILKEPSEPVDAPPEARDTGGIVRA